MTAYRPKIRQLLAWQAVRKGNAEVMKRHEQKLVKRDFYRNLFERLSQEQNGKLPEHFNHTD